jgi:hypothetical protein
MEREPSPLYSGSSAVRNSRAPPVLQVNVLYGITGEEAAGNGAGPLGSSTAATMTGHSAINLSRAATVCNFGAHASVAASTTRRATLDAANPNSGVASLTVLSGATPATTTSTLAKPVLDPSQIRCCPLDQWIPDAHVVNCMAPDCANNFSLFNRKHRCRMCGRVFCASCCNNLVYLSAVAVAPGVPETPGANSSSSNNNNNNNSSNMSYTTTNNSSTTTPEPAGVGVDSNAASNAGTASSMIGPGGGGGVQRGMGGDFSAGSTSPAVMTPTTTNQTGLLDGGVSTPTTTSNNNNSSSSPAVSAGAATTMVAASSTSSSVTANLVPCRVCASCSYEVQLVVSTRQDNGELRRRSRGELKMLQRVLLVNVMTYLNLRDLVSVALVSADFYFMSRDNVIWYQYNMTRWMQEGEATQLSSLKSRAAALKAHRQRSTPWYGGGGTTSSSLADDIFNSTPVIQDATALSESEAAKRVISLHARYNYTQFLDFARRQEMARCEGLSSFSLGARILLSSPLRVALVGPSGIGKTAALQAFLGEKPTQMVVRPTIGFVRRATSVRLAGGLSAEVTLHIYDVSGADRYAELRRFVCRHCHVIGLCYDPAQKVTLVQAADIMMELESALGPQPVVVCGLLRRDRRHTAAAMGKGGEMRPVPQTTSYSVGALEAGAVKKTLVLEELNAPSMPLNSDGPSTSAAAGAMDSLPDIDKNGSTPLSTSRGGNAGGSDALAGAAGSHVTLNAPPAAENATALSSDVSVEDAVGITVRGLASIQCPMMHPGPLFEALVQAVLDRLGEATVANTTTISEISAELTSQGEFSLPPSAMNRKMSTAAGTASRSTPASVVRSSMRRRRPAASRTIVQDLLNLTMQPCALDILLDRK